MGKNYIYFIDFHLVWKKYRMENKITISFFKVFIIFFFSFYYNKYTKWLDNLRNMTNWTNLSLKSNSVFRLNTINIIIVLYMHTHTRWCIGTVFVYNQFTQVSIVFVIIKKRVFKNTLFSIAPFSSRAREMWLKITVVISKWRFGIIFTHWHVFQKNMYTTSASAWLWYTS